jgi:hypothetical protein
MLPCRDLRLRPGNSQVGKTLSLINKPYHFLFFAFSRNIIVKYYKSIYDYYFLGVSTLIKGGMRFPFEEPATLRRGCWRDVFNEPLSE